ncbi:hypothetical protein [Tuberibacillus sp. Marseille-P3662]|uniref:hypothetical protein n=1 Tax=Tuberibacillus sp. Marseille-P3662 TaxID=1965358 RepID=UPI000A1C7DA2|nr:hypothetical protein [Tuberibacillus sp. Marseille-P3662]
MSKQVFVIDSEGYFVKPYMLKESEELESNMIEIAPPDGIYQPFKWDGGQWVSDLTQEEIDEIKANEPVPPPSNEELKKENEELKQKLANAEQRLSDNESAMVSVMDTVSLKGGA